MSSSCRQQTNRQVTAHDGPNSLFSIAKMILSKISLALAAFSGLALAHPGHDHADEVLERRRFIDAIKRADLSHCAEHLVAKGVVKRNAARRAEIVEKARGKSMST